MDMEDEAQRAPQVEVGVVDRSEEAVSMLWLYDEEEGYDPMAGFKDSLNDINELIMEKATTWDGGGHIIDPKIE